MLELTGGSRQADAADRICYFSLSDRNSPFPSGLWRSFRRRQPVNNIRSTLATVWRIAIPYFRSEDKWAGRGLLAAVVVIELAVVGLNVLFNRWNNVFYNALQERDFN